MAANLRNKYCYTCFLLAIWESSGFLGMVIACPLNTNFLDVTYPGLLVVSEQGKVVGMSDSDSGTEDTDFDDEIDPPANYELAQYILRDAPREYVSVLWRAMQISASYDKALDGSIKQGRTIDDVFKEIAVHVGTKTFGIWQTEQSIRHDQEKEQYSHPDDRKDHPEFSTITLDID